MPQGDGLGHCGLLSRILLSGGMMKTKEDLYYRVICTHGIIPTGQQGNTMSSYYQEVVGLKQVASTLSMAIDTATKYPTTLTPVLLAQLRASALPVKERMKELGVKDYWLNRLK